MQVSLSFLLLGVLYLLQLIATVYVNVVLKMQYSVKINLFDAMLLVILLSGMVLVQQYIISGSKTLLTPGWNAGLLFIILTVFLLLTIIRFVWLLRKVSTLRHELIIPRAIRETIDHLPGGICFSTPGGNPVLTNYRMNELVFLLTDSTIMNVLTTWEELRNVGLINGCIKLDDPWMYRGNQDLEAGKADMKAEDDCIFFSLPDDRIWRFRKEELTDRVPSYIQLEATEITELYRYSKALYNNNLKLSEQYRRQMAILENIVEINHEKEILATKIRIHDDLGRSLITTKQHLFNKTLKENITYLDEIWQKTIRNLTDVTQVYVDAETSPEIELHKAADMIGCHISIDGDRPTGRKPMLLFYAIVREALTNAVIHAKADRINVTVQPTAQGYNVVISDNGAVLVSSVKEGGGLSNLRKRFEQEGAALKVKCMDGVVLIAEIPAERI